MKMISFFLSYTILVTGMLVSCQNNNREKQILLEVTLELNDKKGQVFANTFISWSDVNQSMEHLFNKDSVMEKFYFVAKYSDVMSELDDVDYDKLIKSLNPSENTLLETAPFLSDSVRIINGERHEIIRRYDKDWRLRNRGTCFNWFAKPIFTENGFCFFYHEYYCSPENGGGQLFLYKFIEGSWEVVAFLPLFIA